MLKKKNILTQVKEIKIEHKEIVENKTINLNQKSVMVSVKVFSCLCQHMQYIPTYKYNLDEMNFLLSRISALNPSQSGCAGMEP